MSEKYRLIKHNENLAEIGNNKGLGLLLLVDEDCERKLRIIVDLLNEQQTTITELERKLKKYAKIGEEQLKQIIELQETETFTVPPNCDECDFLGNNGICGYCKFTLNCYDSKEDLINGEVLPNCPLKPLINMNEQLREINKEIGDDLYNCRLNKNIISEKLKLWQDTLSEYDIYTIKDLGESFELDAELSKEKDEKIKELEVKVLNLELKNEELMKNE